MLDLTQAMQRLTQGQSVAEMITLSPPQTGSSGGGGVGGQTQSAPPAGAGAAAPAPAGAEQVDARLIAARVYELMRSDLIVLHERRGHR